MYKGIKRGVLVFVASVFVFSACGRNEVKNTESEYLQATEEIKETENEGREEIIDATDILEKVWDTYEEESRFDIMGGHFEAAVLGKPAKYNLTKSAELVQMYCVPDSRVYVINDAATMIDFYNAARFTAGAYHVWDVDELQTMVYEMRSLVYKNKWHGEKPEKIFIVKIDEEYVVSVYGRETLVNEFKQKLADVYGKMVTIMIEEKVF